MANNIKQFQNKLKIAFQQFSQLAIPITTAADVTTALPNAAPHMHHSFRVTATDIGPHVARRLHMVQLRHGLRENHTVLQAA